jgi:catalase
MRRDHDDRQRSPLIARLFSCHDTHLHRVGSNAVQPPVNRPPLGGALLQPPRRLVSNIVGHVKEGVEEPVLSRVFEYWRSVDEAVGDAVEAGVL